MNAHTPISPVPRRRGRWLLKWACTLMALGAWLTTAIGFLADVWFERPASGHSASGLIGFVGLHAGSVHAEVEYEENIRSQHFPYAEAERTISIRHWKDLTRDVEWRPRFHRQPAAFPWPAVWNIQIPLYLLALPPTILALHLHRRDRRLAHRLKHHLCTRCGYSLADLAPQAPCPECGAPTPPLLRDSATPR